MNEAQEDIKLPTAKLMDEETKTIAQKRATISRVTLEIEQILLREDMTMGDLAEVMDLFNARAHHVFSLTKIKDLKNSYGTNN